MIINTHRIAVAEQVDQIFILRDGNVLTNGNLGIFKFFNYAKANETGIV